MEFIIAIGNLRVPIGYDFRGGEQELLHSPSDNKVVYCYIPFINLPMDQYQLPSRDASILNLKVGSSRASFAPAGKKGAISEKHRVSLGKALSTNLGLSPKDADLFLSRGLDVVRRTEEEIKGIVDSLLLFDVSIFGTKVGYGILKSLIRDIFKTSTYSVDEVTRQWKNFTVYVWNKASKAETLEEPCISRESIFRPLLGWKYLSDLVQYGIKDKRDSENLAHLTSTRQLVAGGRRVMWKALEKFRSTATEKRVPDGNLDHLQMASQKIGRKCLKADYQSAAHVSLTTAGTYENPVSQGGRQSTIRDEIMEVLNYVPDCNQDVELPCGYLVHDKEGIPRWKTWAREETLWSDGDFGEERDDYSMLGEVRYWGFDEALGRQIFFVGLYCAERDGYLNLRGEVLRPIPARSISIPEPGGKSRVVTTSLWWVTILQQPGGHTLKKVLEAHPSAEGGLKRADQAWLYLNLLRKADPVEDGVLLSSDLEEATDALIHESVRRAARGFITGAHIVDPLVELGLNLVLSPRQIEANGQQFVTSQGILMGEPMTKALLTLYNLAMEELAIRQFLGTNELPYEGPVQVPWRAFAVGGDDHIAYGPKDYLRRITDNHIAFGSKISKTKHSMSSVAVRYCEKVLHLQGKNLKISMRDINRSTEMYEQSVFVDSIKVRLLAPISKSIEVKNDRNIAIGKAISIGKTLRWLNHSVFPIRWVKMVRQRFIRRMKHYLPKEDTIFYNQILLPQSLGGLDLFLKGELGQVIMKCPAPTQYMVYLALQGQADPIYSRRLKMVTTNAIERGFQQEDEHYGIKKQFETDFFDKENIGSRTLLQEEGSDVRPRPIYEVRDELGLSTDLSLGDLIKALQKKGFLTLDEIIRQCMRGELFQDMLLSKGVPRSYSTIPWKKRFDSLWDELEALGLFDKSRKDEVRSNLFKFQSRFAEIENFDRFLPLMVRDVSQPITSWSFHEGEPVKVMETPLESYSRDIPQLRLAGLEKFYMKHYMLPVSAEGSLQRNLRRRLPSATFVTEEGKRTLPGDFSLSGTTSIELLRNLN